MASDRDLMWALVATKHLLESRLHLVAAMEAMADMEGFAAEHQQLKTLRSSLDDLFMAVEEKAMDLERKEKEET